MNHTPLLAFYNGHFLSRLRPGAATTSMSLLARLGGFCCVLALLCALISLPRGEALDVYRSSPDVDVNPPFGNSVLILKDANITFDMSLQTFQLTALLAFGKDDVSSKLLPLVVLNGGVSFTVAQQMLFTISNGTIAACNDNNGAPPMCPFMSEQVTAQPWTFGYRVVGSNTQWFTLAGFLGANVVPQFVCQGVCSDIAAQVPPAPLPQNASFTVRHRFVFVDSCGHTGLKNFS